MKFHTRQFTGAGEAEARLLRFEADKPAEAKVEAKPEAKKNAPEKAPVAARKERAAAATKTIESSENRVKKTIFTEFKTMKGEGKSAAEIKDKLEKDHAGFTLNIEGEELKSVDVDSAARAESVRTSIKEIVGTDMLDDETMAQISQDLKDIDKLLPGVGRQVMEYIYGNKEKVKDRAQAVNEFGKDEIFQALRLPVGDYESVMDAIAAGDFAAIDASEEPKIKKVGEFLKNDTNREVAVFLTSIVEEGIEKRLQDPRALQQQMQEEKMQQQMEKQYAEAQAKLDEIGADPTLSPEDAAMKKGMIMFNYGVDVKDVNGKLTIVRPDPTSKIEGIMNRLGGIVAWMGALGAKLKGYGKDLKEKAAGAAKQNVPDGNNPEVKNVAAVSADDPVDKDIRKEIKDEGKTAISIESDLKPVPDTTLYAKTVKDRDTARTNMNTANNTVVTLKQRLEDEQRAADAKPTEQPLKDKVLQTQRAIRDAELEAKKMTEKYNDAQQDLAKLDSKKTKLENSKKDFDKLYTSTTKEFEDAKKILDVDGLRDKKNAKDLLTILKNTPLKKNEDFLRIDMLNKDDISKLRDIAKLYPSLKVEDSAFVIEGRNSLENPRSFMKFITDLTNLVKEKPEA